MIRLNVYYYNKAIDDFRSKVLSNPVLDTFLESKGISLLTLRIWAVDRFFEDFFIVDGLQVSSISLMPEEVLFIAHHPEFIPSKDGDGAGTFRGTKIYKKQ